MMNHYNLPPEADNRDRLDVCPMPECGSELVHPQDWEKLDDAHIQISCRCPNCEWTGVGVHSRDQALDFEDRLEYAAKAIAKDLRILGCAIMQDELGGFVEALHTERITPEDLNRM